LVDTIFDCRGKRSLPCCVEMEEKKKQQQVKMKKERGLRGEG
jgi:hypothetical protein